jgi:N-acetylmuramoyl-L-alanine amidase
VDQVIGHNESLSSPFYKELDPRFKGQTHSDWNHADMQIYRSDLTKLGAC